MLIGMIVRILSLLACEDLNKQTKAVEANYSNKTCHVSLFNTTQDAFGFSVPSIAGGGGGGFHYIS